MSFDAPRFTLLSFLHKKLSKRHFRPQAVRKQLRGGAIGKTVPDHVAENMMEVARLSTEELLLRSHSHADGLTDDEVHSLRTTFGTNEIQHEKPMTWWAHLWNSYCNPFSLLLTILALISLFTADAKGATVITAMIVLSTVMRFVQERRSNATADKLKAMVSNTATVLRRQAKTPSAAPNRLNLPIKQLVPGDVVLLSAGDIIPADVRIMTAKDLFINQSVLTGESLPVEKFAVHHDSSHCGGGHLFAHGAPGRVLQIAGTAHELLLLACRHPCWVCMPRPTGENLLPTPLRLAVACGEQTLSSA